MTVNHYETREKVKRVGGTQRRVSQPPRPLAIHSAVAYFRYSPSVYIFFIKLSSPLLLQSKAFKLTVGEGKYLAVSSWFF